MADSGYSSLRPLTERLEHQRGGINSGEERAGLFATLTLLAAFGGLMGVLGIYDYFRTKKFAEELVAQDSGTQIAYLKDKKTICVFPIEYLKDDKKAKEYTIPNASIDGLVWDAHGKDLVYLNDVGHIFDTKHQIVSYNPETGASQVVFDLREEKLKLPDDDINKLWLAGERVFFELGDGGIYSFRVDDPSLQKEGNGTYTPQDKCPDGTHLVKHESSEDSQNIIIKDDGKNNSRSKTIGHGIQPVWSPK